MTQHQPTWSPPGPPPQKRLGKGAKLGIALGIIFVVIPSIAVIVIAVGGTFFLQRAADQALHCNSNDPTEFAPDEKVQVYIFTVPGEPLSPDQTAALSDELRSYRGVSSVQFLTANDVLHDLAQSTANPQEILESVDPVTLHEVFEVGVTGGRAAEAVGNSFLDRAFVDEVWYGCGE